MRALDSSYKCLLSSYRNSFQAQALDEDQALKMNGWCVVLIFSPTLVP